MAASTSPFGARRDSHGVHLARRLHSAGARSEHAVPHVGAADLSSTVSATTVSLAANVPAALSAVHAPISSAAAATLSTDAVSTVTVPTDVPPTAVRAADALRLPGRPVAGPSGCSPAGAGAPVFGHVVAAAAVVVLDVRSGG